MIFNENKLLGKVMDSIAQDKKPSSDKSYVKQHMPAFDYSLYGINEKIAMDYTASLLDHIAFVQMAGTFLGLPSEHMAKHDLSKWTIDEFPFYARNFFGDKGDIDGYTKAWLHHMNTNPHHWGYWIFPDGFSPKGSNVVDGIVEMPELYSTEMIADWMGAGMAYQGSWDMSEWLDGNIERIIVHPNTAQYLYSKLSDIGYSDIVSRRNFRTSVR